MHLSKALALLSVQNTLLQALCMANSFSSFSCQLASCLLRKLPSPCHPISSCLPWLLFIALFVLFPTKMYHTL